MRIDFNYEIDFELVNEAKYEDWVVRVLESEGVTGKELSYIFCSDEYLLEINQKYLDHDTFTDIITFDYTDGILISGDIFISVPRVVENATTFKTSFEEELLRVMSHGLLHLIGYNDKTKSLAEVMREKENQKIKLFHVEH